MFSEIRLSFALRFMGNIKKIQYEKAWFACKVGKNEQHVQVISCSLGACGTTGKSQCGIWVSVRGTLTIELVILHSYLG